MTRGLLSSRELRPLIGGWKSLIIPSRVKTKIKKIDQATNGNSVLRRQALITLASEMRTYGFINSMVCLFASTFINLFLVLSNHLENNLCVLPLSLLGIGVPTLSCLGFYLKRISALEKRALPLILNLENKSTGCPELDRIIELNPFDAEHRLTAEGLTQVDLKNIAAIARTMQNHSEADISHANGMLRIIQTRKLSPEAHALIERANAILDGKPTTTIPRLEAQTDNGSVLDAIQYAGINLVHAERG